MAEKEGRDLLEWPYGAGASLSVQGTGFWMAIVSLVVTLAGFSLTIWQVRKTQHAALAVRAEVTKIERSITKYEATTEASKAKTALEYAGRYTTASDWLNLGSSYEDFLGAIHAIQELVPDDVSQFSATIIAATKYGERLCERVAANHSDPNLIDIPKTLSAIRKQSQLMTSIQIALQRSSINGKG